MASELAATKSSKTRDHRLSVGGPSELEFQFNNGKLFDGMDDPDRDRSSVPQPEQK